MAKNPETSIHLVKTMNLSTCSLRHAAKILVSNEKAKNIRTVMQHHAIRKLPTHKQSVGEFERRVADSSIIDTLIEVHPDNKEYIEKELRPLYT